MNDDQLDDLKQFIDAKISQSEARTQEYVGTEIKTLRDEMRHKFTAVRSEMADGFAGAAEAFEEVYELIEDTTASNDARLTKLERQTA